MLTTIKGYFDKGQIYLQEEVPVTTRTDVVVVFMEQDQNHDKQQKRIPGALKGKVTIPDDFNAPIEDLKDYMR